MLTAAAVVAVGLTPTYLLIWALCRAASDNDTISIRKHPWTIEYFDARTGRVTLQGSFRTEQEAAAAAQRLQTKLPRYILRPHKTNKGTRP